MGKFFNRRRGKKTMHKTIIHIYYLLILLFSSSLHANNLPNFADLASANSAAVVNISTKQLKNANYRGLREQFDFPDGSGSAPFDELFNKFFNERMPNSPENRSQSLGSGFIISDDGFILTNHHVVFGADRIEVRLSDKRSFNAKIIGSDKESDIAVIKINAKNLPKVKIGKSNLLKVGEWVLAIGSPFGFDHSVTAGIVSAKGRNLPSENYVSFIQTDVAINPGNSGGPLFNMRGEVIGINSQIYSRTGGFMGLSFAIPIELAINVAQQIKENGKVSRGYLGVLIQDVNRDLAESFGLDQPMGALVAQVLPNSPAAKIGLKAGDIIVKFNGLKIFNSSELPPIVGATRVEEKAQLEILRSGKKKKFFITIAKLPNKKTVSVDKKANSTQPSLAEKLGLKISDMTKASRKRSGLSNGGALITQVSSGAGKRAGFRKGDVVKMFDQIIVRNAEHLSNLLQNSKEKKSVAVLILRYDKPLFIAFKK